MIQHYVLTLNPESEYEWEKCILRNPLTGERPDLTQALAEAVNREKGSYLVSVKIEVEILEQSPLPVSDKAPVELSREKRLRQLAAS